MYWFKMYHVVKLYNDNVYHYLFVFFGLFCSHERVLEAITEEAEKQDTERFQPLLTGMRSSSIALKVHIQMRTHISPLIGSHMGFCLANDPARVSLIDSTSKWVMLYKYSIKLTCDVFLAEWLHAVNQRLDQPCRRTGLQNPYSLWTAKTGS